MSFPTGAMQQLRDFIEAAGQRPILKKPRDLTYGVDALLLVPGHSVHDSKTTEGLSA